MNLKCLPPQGERPSLFLFDTFDQTSSPFLESLKYVDAYYKSQIYSNVAEYHSSFAGGYVVFRLGASAILEQTWKIGILAPRCRKACESKLLCGWNMGVSRFYKYLSRLSDSAVSHGRSDPYS